MQLKQTTMTVKEQLKLTLDEALCIINRGWRTEDEKELYDYSWEIINKEAEKHHLRYKIFLAKKKLEDLYDTQTY